MIICCWCNQKILDCQWIKEKHAQINKLETPIQKGTNRIQRILEQHALINTAFVLVEPVQEHLLLILNQLNLSQYVTGPTSFK